jgi:hypothetical protein
VQNYSGKILSRIYGHGRGWSFSQIDFFDVAEKEAVSQVLSRAARKGMIRRLTHGIYDYPAFSKRFNPQLPPQMDRVARRLWCRRSSMVALAFARKFQWSIVPDGATALHSLGLDTQVPARFVYLSSGPSRVYDILGRPLAFVHRKTAHTTISDHFAATIVQAIEALGREGIDYAVRTHISRLRSATEFRKIVKDTRSVTAWIHDEIMTIATLAETHEAQT